MPSKLLYFWCDLLGSSAEGNNKTWRRQQRKEKERQVFPFKSQKKQREAVSVHSQSKVWTRFFYFHDYLHFRLSVNASKLSMNRIRICIEQKKVGNNCKWHLRSFRIATLPIRYLKHISVFKRFLPFAALTCMSWSYIWCLQFAPTVYKVVSKSKKNTGVSKLWTDRVSCQNERVIQ